MARLEAGEIDVDAVGLTPRVAQRFGGGEGYRIAGIPGEQFSLELPSQNPVLADARVRRAVGLAIDRPALVSALFDGAGRPAFGPFQPQHWAYEPSIAYDPDPDPEAAVALLEDAGWVEGSDGVRVRDGERLTLTYVHGPSPLDANAALFIADSLRGLGLELELEVVESFDDRIQRLAAGAVISGRPGNAFDPELEVYQAFHSDNIHDNSPGTNRTHIDDHRVDAAIEAGRATNDREERRRAYAQLQTALQDHGAVHYIAQRDYQLIVSNRVQGLDPGAIDSHLHGWSRAQLWNLHEWRLE